MTQNAQMRQQALLKEYELAQSWILDMERIIWTMLSLLSGLSVGGVAFLLRHDTQSCDRVALLWVLAVGSSFVLWFWLKIQERWSNWQSVRYRRMRQIERYLVELWATRDVHYLSRDQNGRECLSRDQSRECMKRDCSDEERKRYEALEKFEKSETRKAGGFITKPGLARVKCIICAVIAMLIVILLAEIFRCFFCPLVRLPCWLHKVICL